MSYNNKQMNNIKIRDDYYLFSKNIKNEKKDKYQNCIDLYSIQNHLSVYSIIIRLVF